MLVWFILQILGALILVLPAFIAQARESLHPPMNTPSLGTFGVIMMAGFYFMVAGPINAVIVGSRLHWPWYATFGAAIAAAAIGLVGSYVAIYPMATKGGTAITVLGGLILAALLAANLRGPRLV